LSSPQPQFPPLLPAAHPSSAAADRRDQPAGPHTLSRDAFWILFALSLAVIDRIRTVEELPWHAHVLAALSVVHAVMVDFYAADTWHGIHIRTISMSMLVVCMYLLARLVRLPAAFQVSPFRYIYTWIGTGFAAWLMWSELRPIYVAVGLGVFGLGLFEIGRWSG